MVIELQTKPGLIEKMDMAMEMAKNNSTAPKGKYFMEPGYSLDAARDQAAAIAMDADFTQANIRAGQSRDENLSINERLGHQVLAASQYGIAYMRGQRALDA
jgi:hypothetical protein